MNISPLQEHYNSLRLKSSSQVYLCDTVLKREHLQDGTRLSANSSVKYTVGFH